MARVNAYLRASSDNGREASVGGRSASDRVTAWLNTANRLGEASMAVAAEVIGPGLRSKDRRKNGVGDQRRSVFTVTLPPPSEAVEVDVLRHGSWADSLIAMGALLCGAKAVGQISAGDVEGGRITLENVGKILEEHEASMNDLPHVNLPGGVSLRQALAAVAVVKRLREQGGSAN